MAKLTVSGVPPYDGTYDLPLTRLTQRDYHTIKVVAGVRANELGDAAVSGDLDIAVALAVCALYRAGHRDRGVADALWDAEVGKIMVALDADEEDDAGPPAQTPPAESGSGNEKNGSSGATTKPIGGHPESLPSRTGTPLSERSAT